MKFGPLFVLYTLPTLCGNMHYQILMMDDLEDLCSSDAQNAAALLRPA